MAKQHKQPPADVCVAAPGAVTILVERLADQRFIAGMFRRELDAGEIEIEVCITASGITGTAQRLLLEQPEQRVALVPNATCAAFPGRRLIRAKTTTEATMSESANCVARLIA